MRSISTLLLLLLPLRMWAQLHDNTWLFGYSNNQDTTDKFGIVVLTFNGGDLQMRQDPNVKMEFNNSNCAYSKFDGQIHSYSNSLYFEHISGNLIEGSADLLIDDPLEGDVNSQNIISLPIFGDTAHYLYLYQNNNYLPDVQFCATKLMTSKIDLTKNEGIGKVIERNKVFLADTLSMGGVITVVKHANGRDWWLLANEIYTNKYYRVLIEPDTIQMIGIQTIGTPLKSGSGQTSFSPDGTKYAKYYSISSQLGAYLEIYEFDRCTGLLNNHRQFHFTNRGWGGLAFSPNSRFLYLDYESVVYQYDMQAPDVFDSRIQIAEWDGFQSPFPTGFYKMQLAPDGKIYASTVSGCDVLHVIQRPDEFGTACRYEQHAIQLPTYNAHSMPNFPNYRLGPVDGSVCDSLGINNMPVSWWRYDRDTSDALSFEFRDNSWYEPTSWSWDFGDGTGSAERHPVHQFTVAGHYEVCLTVSNVNGTDTRCKTVFAGVSATADPDLQSHMQVAPNPFQQQFTLSLSTAIPDPVMHIYDLTGQLIAAQPLVFGVNEISLTGSPPGVYFYKITSREKVISVGKVVKMD